MARDERGFVARQEQRHVGDVHALASAWIGIAFDTNMLAKPTPRRLMTLWLEQAGCRTLVLPRVYEELTVPTLARGNKRYEGRNIQAETWDQAIHTPDSP